MLKHKFSFHIPLYCWT